MHLNDCTSPTVLWPEWSWTLASWESLQPRAGTLILAGRKGRSPGFPACKMRLWSMPLHYQSVTGWFCCSPAREEDKVTVNVIVVTHLFNVSFNVSLNHVFLCKNYRKNCKVWTGLLYLIHHIHHFQDVTMSDRITKRTDQGIDGMEKS